MTTVNLLVMQNEVLKKVKRNISELTEQIEYLSLSNESVQLVLKASLRLCN